MPDEREKAQRRRRWWACLRKRRYGSLRGAGIAAKFASERTGQRQRPYKCEYGDHYHLSSRKRRED